MRLLRLILREPLLHFLILGAGLFGLFHYVDRGNPQLDPRTILVDRSRLLAHLQNRSKAYDDAHFSRVIDGMGERQLKALIDDYAREEALYREAKALRVDENDYVSRRRLVQQMEFIIGGFAGEGDPPTPAEIEAYFSARRDQYAEEPSVTFTHVFFDQNLHGARTQALARAELATLNELGVSFVDAPRHGDRFLYHVNYVQKTKNLIVSHFGPGLAQVVFTRAPDATRWQGPIQSKHGWHLVLMTSRREGGTPEFESVRSRVQRDLERARQEERTQAALAGFISGYQVRIEPIRASVQRLAPAASP